MSISLPVEKPINEFAPKINVEEQIPIINLPSFEELKKPNKMSK